jgi:hypothetical protein
VLCAPHSNVSSLQPLASEVTHVTVLLSRLPQLYKSRPSYFNFPPCRWPLCSAVRIAGGAVDRAYPAMIAGSGQDQPHKAGPRTAKGQQERADVRELKETTMQSTIAVHATPLPRRHPAR